jgi:hypothetical protein
MSTTTTSDLIVPEILQDAIQAEFAGMKLLAGTPAAVMSNSFPAGTQKGGTTITIPYFDALGELEDITTEGDALTPEAMAMTDETTTVQHSGKAVEMTHWSRLAAEYADPYAEMARQFRVLVERRADKALIAAATTSLSSSMKNDVSVGSGAKVTLNYDNMVDSKLKWGDEQGDIVLLGVHSKVYGDLLKLKDSTGRPLLTLPTAADVARFCGIPVIVSDKCTKSTKGSYDTYDSLIVKRSALAFWYQEAPRVLTDQDVLADTDVAAIHLYWAAHRYKRTPGFTLPGVVQIVTN